MAEKAAHFTTTLEAKPSIFEVIAQKSLNDTLYPAFGKLAEFLANYNQDKLGWILKYYDETFLIINGILQYYYLKKYNGSFAEYFYNLERIPSNGGKFTDKQRKISLFFLVILPYFYKKLERKIDLYRLEEADGLLNNTLKCKLKRTLLYVQSVYEIGWGGWLILNYLKYMADKTEYQLPLLSLIQLKLIYSPNLQESEGFWSALLAQHLSFKDALKGLFQNSVQNLIEIGAFFTQFLNVWNVEQSNYNINALPLIPPPPKDTNVGNYMEKCPICLQSWKIPTILPVSGYVFCFSCILKHLEETKACPVTKLPASQLDVIRLYDGDSC